MAAVVISLQGPDHGSSQALGNGKVHLVLDTEHVVVADPLIAGEGVGSGVAVIEHGLPVVQADLVVAQVAALAGVGSAGATASARSSGPVLGGVRQLEGASVHANAQDKLVGGSTLAHPEVNGVLDGPLGGVEAGLAIGGHGEVVGHHIDEVHVLGNVGNLVRGTGNTLSGSNSNTQLIAIGSEAGGLKL